MRAVPGVKVKVKDGAGVVTDYAGSGWFPSSSTVCMRNTHTTHRAAV